MKTTIVTVEELRKKASELGIKNIKNIRKMNLLLLLKKQKKR